MQREPPPFVWAVPDEKNILAWHYILRGPPDTPFAGGEYHGVLLFPSEYPFKPPGIKMFTPSGRFQPDKKICFSMSDFHPGSWNPAWSVATILTGLLSFMLSDEMTTGSVTSSDPHKRAFAARSHSWNLTQSRFREAFPDYCQPQPQDLPNMGEKEKGTSELPPQPASPSLSGSSSQQSTPTAQPASTESPSANASNAIPSTVVPRSRKLEENGLNANRGTGWTATWRQIIWEKWRWCALIALAVIVSRISTSS